MIQRIPTKGLNVLAVREKWRRGQLQPGEDGWCWSGHSAQDPICGRCYDADLCAMDRRTMIDMAIGSAPVLAGAPPSLLPGQDMLPDHGHPAPLPPAEIDVTPPPKLFRVPTTFAKFNNALLNLDDVTPYPTASCFFYLLRRHKLIGVVRPTSVDCMCVVVHHCMLEELVDYDVVDPRLLYVGDKEYPDKPMMFVKLARQDDALRIAKGAYVTLKTKLALYTGRNSKPAKLSERAVKS